MFTFSGEPPFSFTYQRTETADTHKNPRVIETHTVTGITERSYSVWTSQEGALPAELLLAHLNELC